MLTLLLYDNTAIEIADATYTKHYVINCESSEAFQAVRNRLTAENLTQIQIKEDDVVRATIRGLVLTGTQEVINRDGTVTGHFYFKGGTEVPSEYEEAGRILLGEEE